MISSNITSPSNSYVPSGNSGIDGQAFRSPANIASNPEQGSAEIDTNKFTEGLKKLGIYEYVRHLDYPVV